MDMFDARKKLREDLLKIYAAIHVVCDIFGRDWSPSANGRRIYQIVCYKMIPNYYPYSINFIFSTYYPINIQKYTHPGGV